MRTAIWLLALAATVGCPVADGSPDGVAPCPAPSRQDVPDIDSRAVIALLDGAARLHEALRSPGEIRRQRPFVRFNPQKF